MQRQSRYVPSMAYDAYDQSASPVVIPHQSYAGLGVVLSDPAATLTVMVGGLEAGPFSVELTMLGTEEFRYPDTDSMNAAYNAPYVQISWTAGTMRLFQKG